jgi:hypothetical protein
MILTAAVKNVTSRVMGQDGDGVTSSALFLTDTSY